MLTTNVVLAAFLGLIGGCCAPVVWWAIRYGVNSFRPTPIEGDWYQCNYTFSDGSLALCREQWRIRRGLRRPLALRVQATPDTGRRYRGYVFYERNHMVAVYEGIGHQETVYARFLFPATPQGQI